MNKIIFLLFFMSSLVFSKEVNLTLEKAISLALENNVTNRISKLNLEIAKAQYNQALSANYPTLDATLYANRDDQDTIFQQRGEFALSQEFINFIKVASGGTFTKTTTPADLDAIAAGRDTVRGQLEVNYPLYTGGKISAIIEQARLNKHIKSKAIIRDRNSVVYDVKKYFYGYVFANELYNLIDSIYQNMKFSRDLTKDFLENGTTLKIKKTDYLNIKLLTSLINSAKTKIELNKKLLVSALTNVVGLKYNDSITISYDEQNILKQDIELQNLVKEAMKLNPDVKTIDLALKVKDAQIDEASADYKPMVNIFGNISHTYNSYKYGYLYEENRNRWSLGVAVKMSLFNGFKTTNEVLEKRLDKKRLNEQKLQLEEGLAIQLKNEFIKSSMGYKQINILKEAVDTAIENSKISMKGYEYEMVDAKDLVQSQLMEVYVKADYLKNVHDYLISLATIDKLVGKKIDESF